LPERSKKRFTERHRFTADNNNFRIRYVDEIGERRSNAAAGFFDDCGDDGIPGDQGGAKLPEPFSGPAPVCSIQRFTIDASEW
jgi:hypothetical protein